jgi:hypothetical protein
MISLIDFILNLFRDPALAAEFNADPQRVLAEAGLGDVDPADCQALIPMVADFAPVSLDGMGGGAEDEDEEPAEDEAGRPSNDVQESTVIHNIRNVENTYNTREVDVDVDASHSIWAGGDAYAIFGDENVLATGGSVAAGEEVEDVRIDNSTDVDIEESFNDKSTTVEGDGNAVGRGNEVDNRSETDLDLDLEVDDIAIGENAANVEDSENVAVGEDNTAGDTEVEIEVEDSTLAGRDVDQSEEETEITLEVEDSTLAGGDVDQSEEENVDVDLEAEFEDSDDNELELAPVD